MREDADGNIVRSEIVRMLKQDKDDTRKRVKFLIKTKNGNESAEEIMEYNELCDLVEKQLHAIENDNLEGVRTFDRILAHQGPLTVKDSRYKGSSYNLLIEWDGMEPAWEPLNIIAADDKVSCAIYGEANGLLDKKGWKYLKKEALNIRKVYKRVQEVLKAKHEAKYKYGIRIPDRTKSFAECDEENGNTAWADANQLEIDLLEAFKAFKDHGEFTQEKADVLIAKGYQYIRMQMIYDAKHDGRQRARFVAGGHMTKADGSNSYSSVVSLRTLRLAMLLGELNRLKIKVGDITSAYSMALTQELVFFKAGPEFMIWLQVGRQWQWGRFTWFKTPSSLPRPNASLQSKRLRMQRSSSQVVRAWMKQLRYATNCRCLEHPWMDRYSMDVRRQSVDDQQLGRTKRAAQQAPPYLILASSARKGGDEDRVLSTCRIQGKYL
jgi:hypothetical protein